MLYPKLEDFADIIRAENTMDGMKQLWNLTSGTHYPKKNTEEKFKLGLADITLFPLLLWFPLGYAFGHTASFCEQASKKKGKDFALYFVPMLAAGLVCGIAGVSLLVVECLRLLVVGALTATLSIGVLPAHGLYKLSQLDCVERLTTPSPTKLD